MFYFNIQLVPKDIPKIYRPPHDALVICVGSIRKLPEAMAPLTGSILYEAGVAVVGSLAEPVLDDDEVTAKAAHHLVLSAKASKEAQPGYTEIEAYPNEKRWVMHVHLPPPERVHYSDIVRYARATAVAIPMLMRANGSFRKATATKAAVI